MKLSHVLLPFACAALFACGDTANKPSSSSSVAISSSSTSISSSSSSSSSVASISSSSSIASVSSSSSSEPEVAGYCPKDEPCRIMPAGDSITFGLAGSGGGYRVELFKLATEAGYDITFVGTAGNNGPDTVAGKPFPKAHEGISGEKIPQLDARMTKTAPAQGSPHIFLIHIGTNDALSSGVSTMTSQLETLIDEVIEKNPDSLLVVSSLIPLSFAQSTIDSYNAAIPGIVQSRADLGMHIIYVDQSGFPESELGDGVHPNDTGYARMGKSWFGAIEQYLGGGGSSTGGSKPVALDGSALYTDHCAGCHGDGKKGKSASAISNAINSNKGGMGSLSSMTSEEIEAVSKAN